MEEVVIVVGGAGALGTAVIKEASKLGYKSVSVDLRPSTSATHSVILSGDDGVQSIVEGVKSSGMGSVKAVYCVAGSWEGGSISHEDVFGSSRRMWQVNVEPSLMAAQLASNLSASLCVLTSAKAVLHPTPDMIGYGLSKRAVVHLTESLAADKSYPSTIVCILPEVIDTPANRTAMPKADTSRWTSLETLAAYLLELLSTRPASGSLITVVTREGQTAFNTVSTA